MLAKAPSGSCATSSLGGVAGSPVLPLPGAIPRAEPSSGLRPGTRLPARTVASTQTAASTGLLPFQGKALKFFSITGQTMESFVKSLDGDIQEMDSDENQFVFALAGIVTST